MGTRKAVQRRRRTRKPQKGGDNSWFQYTDRPVRRLWVKKLYPLGDAIFSELKKIPWKEYSFKGYTLLNTEAETNRNEEIRHIEDYLPVVAKTQATPYYVLGGAACEYWHRMVPRAGDLHATTDPTADIDIKLAPPNFEIDLPDKIQKNFYKQNLDWFGNIYDGDTYSALIDDYTTWLFYEVVSIAQRLQQFIPSKGFSRPSLENTAETEHADRWAHVGPFLVARVNEREAGMIKIQMTTAVKEGNLTRVDHLLEFILTTRGDSVTNPEAEVFESKENDYSGMAKNVGGVYVQNIFQLLLDQARAVKGRANVDPSIRYKLINHYGRLLYLSKLLAYAMKRPDRLGQPMLSEFQYSFITELVTKGIFNAKEGACPPPRGCSAKAFLEPLRGLFKIENPRFKSLRDAGFSFNNA